MAFNSLTNHFIVAVVSLVDMSKRLLLCDEHYASNDLSSRKLLPNGHEISQRVPVSERHVQRHDWSDEYHGMHDLYTRLLLCFAWIDNANRQV